VWDQGHKYTNWKKNISKGEISEKKLESRKKSMILRGNDLEQRLLYVSICRGHRTYSPGPCFKDIQFILCQ
jgi:hypothetical protein